VGGSGGWKGHARNILGTVFGVLLTGTRKSDDNLVKNVRRISGSEVEHEIVLI
jgi:hypothetical protein